MFQKPVLFASAAVLLSPLSTALSAQGKGLANPAVRARQRKPAVPDRPSNPFLAPFRFNVPAGFPVNEAMKLQLAKVKQLRAIYMQADDKGFDDEGRPYCSVAKFVELRQELSKSLSGQSGYLFLIALNSESLDWRQSAYWAAFLLPEIDEIFDLAAIIPYEPHTAIRQEALTMASRFLPKYFSQRGKLLRDVPGYKKTKRNLLKATNAYTYDFRVISYADLLRSSNVNDRLLALRVLTDFAKQRRDHAVELLRVAGTWFTSCATSKTPALAAAARGFFDAIDDDPPCPTDPDAARAHCAKLIRKIFPDIRLRGGLCDLYPGPDLDKIVATVRGLLASGEIGEPARTFERSGKTKYPRYGMEIAGDEALKKIGLTSGAVLTAINGVPIKDGPQLLATIEKLWTKKCRSFTLEWVDEQHAARAVRYVVRAEDRGVGRYGRVGPVGGSTKKRGK